MISAHVSDTHLTELMDSLSTVVNWVIQIEKAVKTAKAPAH